MAADSQPAIRVDGYRQFTRIGAGGFSSVYRAEQNALGRAVAVKVLHTTLDSEQEAQTFERECRALGLLSRHPNIVTVYHDAVADDGRRCIVMELYRGTVREQLTREGARPVAEVVRLGIKIGSALQVAHDAGVLHRDVKPHNILLSDYSEPALSDFGISVIDLERSVSAASGLSLAYASPEALDGRRATRASDIYSLGATLFHLLEGEPPFAAPRLEATLAKIMTEVAPELSRDDVPSSLRSVLRSCLAKSPADRPVSAGEFIAALRDVETESGFDRTPVPQMLRDHPSGGEAGGDVSVDGDALTIGEPGDAVASAVDAPRSGGQSDDADDSISDEVSARSNQKLWPSGWSPWGADGVGGADGADGVSGAVGDGVGGEHSIEDTIVRPPAGVLPTSEPASLAGENSSDDAADAVVGWTRRPVVIVAVAAAAVILTGLLALLILRT